MLSLLVSFGLLIIAMTVHEFAHGWVAYKLGDMTAKYSGRLTLNPLAHIDPIGTLLLPFILFISTGGRFVFGYAKPVPINYWGLKNPRRDMGLIGLSGPAANLILAFILSIAWKALPVDSLLRLILEYLISINVILGIFNLIPIPPLDGSRILSALLPFNLASQYNRLEPYGFILLLLLITSGITNIILWPLVRMFLAFLGVSF
ncbi:MAG: site-2 protease family protein [Candidatus Omnitrophica bacterium]|jgi:Zn-dependent protease|nr:site-2 protease family protein [Candidatus Omnitrophota bacterium]